MTKTTNSPSHPTSKVAVFDADGFLVARVTPGYLDRALASGEVAPDPTGRFRTVAERFRRYAYRSPAQVDADKAAAAWTRAHGPKVEDTVDADVVARRKAAGAKAAATRRANLAAKAAA